MLAPSSQFDLAIVGGGPAGSSAAITAARLGLRVVLLEARDFPRHKVCGEFVSGEALDVLAWLLQEVPAAKSLFENAPVVDRTRLLRGTRVVEAPVSPAGLSVTRYDLDHHLWRAAQASGVKTRANSEVLACAGDGPFQLRTTSGAVAAKALIVAAGRWSQFTSDRAIPPGPKWIGLKAHFREPNPPRSTDLYFFQNGYCGVQPVARDVVNACAMVRSDAATSLREVFALHHALARRSAGWKAVSSPVTTAPLVYRRPQAIRANTMLVGDAAAFIDPFVGDGISIALRSGKAAGEWMGRFIAGETTLPESVAAYRDEYFRRFVPLLSAALRVRSLLSLPEFAKVAAFELLRFPGVMPFVIRKTRRAG